MTSHIVGCCVKRELHCTVDLLLLWVASVDWLLPREDRGGRFGEGRVENTRAATRSTCQLRRFTATSDREQSDTSFTLLLDLNMIIPSNK